MLPASENNRSEGTEVAENARNFFANAAKFGYSFLFVHHHIRGL
ncbi:3641_t:CDS:1, partial [Cetraspora pellucida]